MSEQKNDAATKHEKGTCLRCGSVAPDSVICDRCFLDVIREIPAWNAKAVNP